MRGKAEFTVEPFVDANPGPHVLAAIDEVRSRGFEAEIKRRLEAIQKQRHVTAADATPASGQSELADADRSPGDVS